MAFSGSFADRREYDESWPAQYRFWANGKGPITVRWPVPIVPSSDMGGDLVFRERTEDGKVIELDRATNGEWADHWIWRNRLKRLDSLVYAGAGYDNDTDEDEEIH